MKIRPHRNLIPQKENEILLRNNLNEQEKERKTQMKAMKAIKTIVAVTVVTSALVLEAAEQMAEQAVELAPEEKSALSVKCSLDVLSDYIWRGTICNGNPVWQPSVTLGYDTGDYGAFAANIWSSFDLTHKRGTSTASRRAGGIQEIDYTLSYAVELAGVGLEIGHIWYQFPNANGPTDQDLYVTVSYENPIATPSASAYWNYSDSAGNDVSSLYYTVGLSHEFQILDALTLTPSASLGFGGNAWTSCGTELTDQTAGLAAAYALTDSVSLGAQINYTWIPSHTLRGRNYMGDGKDQICWGGLNITLNF